MYRHYLSIHSENSAINNGNHNNDLNGPPLIRPSPILNSKSSDCLSKETIDYSDHHTPMMLPNLSYSPSSSANVSPKHRLYPGGVVHSQSYNNSLSSLHNNVLQQYGFDPPGGITQVKQYHMRDQLGQGSYGLVQLAYNQENSTFYAMKSLSKKKLMRSSGLFNRPMPIRKSTSSLSSPPINSAEKTIDPLQKIYLEIAIHKKLNHPNIVTLIEVLDDPSQQFLYMVFEYVENGAVMQIGKDPPFPESRTKKYFIDTLLGLEYLHYQKIIHRDIKPANLLLSKNDRIKIADFGVSNEFTGDDVYLTSTAGSPAFMAPESVQMGEHPFTGKALDIWALGITLYAFLFAQIPFEHCNRYLLYQMIINNPIIYPEIVVSGDVIDLLKQMLDKDPLTRIKLPEIKIHKWTSDFGTKALPSEHENCGSNCIEVTDDEVANSIRQIPRIETVLKVKRLLKNKSFRNPIKYGSVSTLDSHQTLPLSESHATPLATSVSGGSITPIMEDRPTDNSATTEQHYSP